MGKFLTHQIGTFFSLEFSLLCLCSWSDPPPWVVKWLLHSAFIVVAGGSVLTEGTLVVLTVKKWGAWLIPGAGEWKMTRHDISCIALCCSGSWSVAYEPHVFIWMLSCGLHLHYQFGIKWHLWNKTKLRVYSITVVVSNLYVVEKGVLRCKKKKKLRNTASVYLQIKENTITSCVCPGAM